MIHCCKIVVPKSSPVCTRILCKSVGQETSCKYRLLSAINREKFFNSLNYPVSRACVGMLGSQMTLTLLTALCGISRWQHLGSPRISAIKGYTSICVEQARQLWCIWPGHCSWKTAPPLFVTEFCKKTFCWKAADLQLCKKIDTEVLLSMSPLHKRRVWGQSGVSDRSNLIFMAISKPKARSDSIWQYYPSWVKVLGNLTF